MTAYKKMKVQVGFRLRLCDAVLGPAAVEIGWRDPRSIGTRIARRLVLHAECWFGCGWLWDVCLSAETLITVYFFSPAANTKVISDPARVLERSLPQARAGH